MSHFIYFYVYRSPIGAFVTLVCILFQQCEPTSCIWETWVSHCLGSVVGSYNWLHDSVISQEHMHLFTLFNSQHLKVFTTTETFRNTPSHSLFFSFHFCAISVLLWWCNTHSILLVPFFLWLQGWFFCRKFWIWFWMEGKTETVGERLMISFCGRLSSLCQRS